jgi:hypothetical protein
MKPILTTILKSSNWLVAKGFEPMIKSFGIGYEQELGNRWVLKSSVFTNYKSIRTTTFDILDDQSTSVAYALL